MAAAMHLSRESFLIGVLDSVLRWREFAVYRCERVV